MGSEEPGLPAVRCIAWLGLVRLNLMVDILSVSPFRYDPYEDREDYSFHERNAKADENRIPLWSAHQQVHDKHKCAPTEAGLKNEPPHAFFAGDLPMSQ
jgi:hypothetical protein